MKASHRGNLEELFDTATDAYAEQRSDPRQQFHRPAKVRVSDSEYPAFTRNISSTGVGLRHEKPLTPGPVQIEIEHQAGTITALNAELLWCCRQGNHYISGAQFSKPLIAKDLA